MRKGFILPLLLAFLLNGISHAATNVSGNIATDSTWTLANSPYIVTDTVQVVEGVKLTIEPGVTVSFSRNALLKIGGELIAEGTETQMITFTSNGITPGAGDWGPLDFIDSAVGSVLGEDFEYESGSIIKYCDIEHGKGIQSAVGLYIGYSNLSNNDNGIQFLIYGEGLPSSADNNISTIVGNTIQNAGGSGPQGSGISVEGGMDEAYNMLVTGNTITNNPGSGIYIFTSNITYSISDNIITNNSRGITVWASADITCTITGNTITESDGDGISITNYYVVGTPHNITITNNIIRDNQNGITVNLDGVPNITSDISITANDIANNSAIGIYIDIWGLTTCYIAKNTIRENGEAGIVIGNTNIAPSGGGPYDVTITGNTVANNLNGIKLLVISGELACVVSRNTIANSSDDGILVRDGRGGTAIITVIENNIHGNGQYAIHNEKDTEITATNNWWGTTSISEIEETIYDYYDNLDIGKVLFQPAAQSSFSISELPPIARFIASPLFGSVALTVQFTDKSFGSPTSWVWDFGTETTSTEQNPSYTYTTGGIFTVSLTVSNEFGADTQTKADYITVQSCGDHNGDGVVNIHDVFDKRADLTQDFKTWIQECWLEERRGSADLEIAEELIREFSE